MRIVTGGRLDKILSKPNYQMFFPLNGEHFTPPHAFDAAHEILRLWLKRKLENNEQMFSSLSDCLHDCACESGAISVGIVCQMGEYRRWACQFKQPDTRLAGRMWSTQILLEETAAAPRLSVLNLCTYPASSRDAVPLSVPAFVPSIIEQIGVFDVRPVDLHPWVLTEGELPALASFLCDKSRILPTVIVSSQLTEGNDDAQRYLVPPQELARQLAGLAHVVALPDDVAAAWTERVGRRWSVFGGAVRTYLPEVDFAEGDCFDHPLVLAGPIGRWDGGLLAFLNYLKGFISRYNLGHITPFEDNQLYNRLKQDKVAYEISQARDNLADIDAMLELYRQENDSLRQSNKELQQQVNGLEYDFIQSDDARQNAESECRRKEGHIAQLLAQLSPPELEELRAWPHSYDEIAAWCGERFSDKLVVTGKAKRALKDAQFEEVELVCRALELYAGAYRDMRLRSADDGDARRRYEEQLNELGLEDLGNPISESRRGERENVYSMQHDGVSYQMDHHLGKGRGGMDPRYCLRIYSSWDPEKRLVVLGSLPSHLETRISN